jgi:hypothetical protein
MVLKRLSGESSGVRMFQPYQCAFTKSKFKLRMEFETVVGFLGGLQSAASRETGIL